jgi:peptidoglycan/xylan/chitin deacetylase (PgdA/CDA1 family)
MSTRAFMKRTSSLVACLVAATSLISNATDVVYVSARGDSSHLQQRIKTASDFYGLKDNAILFTNITPIATVVNAIEDPKTIAVVLSADALPSLDMPQILAALRRKQTRTLPLLIAGINEHTDGELLKNWSGRAITGCTAVRFLGGTGSYRFASVNGLTHELGDNELPMSPRDVRYLMLGGARAERIMTTVSGDQSLPIFARVTVGTQELFFATESGPVEMPSGADPYQESRVFASLAQEMIFLRYAGGERVWHSPGRYANLTIDDAWLKDQYGFVNYKELLGEMEQHNFHTTIAFVPWNFDRSEPVVVSLFQKHRDRFSICIHGNNHDHQEFGRYDDRPLTGQTKDVRQSLARMAKFQELTEIPYDPVMVFPHSISPERTFAVLKRYNFWSTSNSLNVPMGAAAPANLEYILRTVTLAFANFPSLRRYSAESPGPYSQLVIDAFLGNPMLFYAHQGFFAPGIGAFNKTADVVNRLQPATQWRSLGYITKHLYLEKLRDDGNYDVRAYGGIVHLENVHQRDATFFVEKQEDFAFPLTVSVDGRPYPYKRLGTLLLIELPVRAGASKEITINYENDLNFATIDVSKTSIRIYAIRHLSDFRDDLISKTALGQWFIRVYTTNEAEWNYALLAVAVSLIAVLGLWSVRRLKRRSISQRLSSTLTRSGIRTSE